MPSSGKALREIGINNVKHQPKASHPGTKAKNVAVIVVSRHAGRVGVAAEGRPNARNFICRDGHTHSGAADQDAQIKLAASHCFGDFVGNIGIVAGFLRMGSKILQFKSLLLQMLEYCLFAANPPWSAPIAIFTLPPPQEDTLL